jgi:hypothetical protein
MTPQLTQYSFKGLHSTLIPVNPMVEGFIERKDLQLFFLFEYYVCRFIFLGEKQSANFKELF